MYSTVRAFLPPISLFSVRLLKTERWLLLAPRNHNNIKVHNDVRNGRNMDACCEHHQCSSLYGRSRSRVARPFNGAARRLSGHAGRLAGLWIQPLRPLAQRGMDTLKDPEFLAEAKKGWLDIEPADGAELEQNVREIFKLEPALTAS